MSTLYMVSTGIGGVEGLTIEARKAIDKSEVIVGYTKYIKELMPLIKDKEIYKSGMTKEIDRCQKAIDFAKSGKTTTIISNGDINIFGMATLIVELIDEQDLWDKIELISLPGVTAVFAAACRVGAPISQDLAIISLSDKLTDIKVINKRVKNALEADFIIGIYNPKSQKRTKPYLNFLDELKKYPKRVVVIASNVGRNDKEKIVITDSFDLIEQGLNHPDITMNTLLIIGNSTTKLTKNNLVLTPRGYLKKYDLEGNLL